MQILSKKVASFVCCPRCGYDLRGAVAAWTDSCPIAGGCSECGLTYAWGVIFAGTFAGPQWCIESARSWRQVPWRFVRTVLMMCRPRRFWAGLTMSASFRVRPFIWGAIMLVPLLYLSMSLTIAVHTWDTTRFSTIGTNHRLGLAAHAGALPFSSAPPQWVARSGLTPAQMTKNFLNVELGFWQFGIFLITRDAAFLPNASGGRAVVWIAVLGCMAVCVPLGFVALPTSRRVCKVRARHLVRIGLYSAMPILVMALLAWHGWLLYKLHIPYNEWRVAQASLVWYPTFLMLWWWIAVRDYLKMQHAFGVAMAMTLFALATSWVIFATVRLVLN